MTTAATRVLRLLSLLQARREWTGAELSERLEIDVRTVRRDANRLRELGYVIESAAGPGGGYRLSAGAHTPPLLLEDEEVLTIALALGAAASTLGNFTQAALGVLVKLDQLLPSRLRRKWKATSNVAVSLQGRESGVDTRLLATLAAACRDGRRVTFKYGDRQNRESLRDVEPMRLVHTGRVWYLAAWDTTRDDWRTFRLDRIDRSFGIRVGVDFVPRKPPEDFATMVSRAITASPYAHQARLRLAMDIEQARRHVPGWIGLLEAADDNHCLLTLGANTLEAMVALIVNAGVAFEVVDSPELAQMLREVAQRLLTGADSQGVASASAAG
jgi:predicted DNA-binding transcriptional regulator YafY